MIRMGDLPKWMKDGINGINGAELSDDYEFDSWSDIIFRCMIVSAAARKDADELRAVRFSFCPNRNEAYSLPESWALDVIASHEPDLVSRYKSNGDVGKWETLKKFVFDVDLMIAEADKHSYDASSLARAIEDYTRGIAMAGATAMIGMGVSMKG